MSGERWLQQNQDNPTSPHPLVFCPKTKTCGYRGAVTLGNKYARLNVGGILFFTPLQVLTSQNSLLGAMFGGKTEVFTDKEGWVLIDRSGKHFNSILNYLRDGTVTLPKGRQAVQELLVEAKYYLIQGLVELCQNTLQPVVKLLYNRSNNKYSYTSNSDDNLLKNIELFDRLSLSFNSRVLFFKDVIGDEICCWSFYGQGRKLAEVCCTSIVYATEKKQTKVEFPEARIYEETLNTLLYETLPLPDNSLLEATRRSYINCGSLSEEEEGPGGTELRERVRRIHIKRYSTYDDRPLGH
ncbi:BTB/POZ domain-containing adapter for CUL3-mediated RhoA degradation protein 2 isoform X2 [Poecilia latipinna]|uniref:BTB/POZ domain-containing adapter for CUL3-mediated RhoA degradation protein 2 isoform X2 n=1 Tax=Poecilia latipinna TaxID=48699 RepID=UPI00072EE84C|nr:PREDICTED: BTB/POZ domain-containing adapter for CUL3-mediated RhoA degradation protein 2-like isoform X2 [Poecilia latipinna]